MILNLTDRCPIFSPENEPALQRLLLTVRDGWHTIGNPPPDRLRKILPAHVWRVYGEFLTQSYKTAANSPAGWTLHTNCLGCDADDLATFCQLRTLIIVEDATSDGTFIMKAVEHLRRRLQKSFNGKRPQVEISHSGGIGTLPREVARRAAIYQKLRPNKSPARVVVVVDSDAARPGQKSPNAKRVEDAAHHYGADVHVFRKRSIENYVPDAALKTYGRVRKDREAAVTLVTSLSPPGRDHYPLKDGLKARDPGLDLYHEDIPHGVKVGDFMVDFLTSFAHTLRESELRERDGEQELDLLLDLIERNL